jgi:predicted ATPase
LTVFLFCEIDHPALFEKKENPETEHLLASQYFLLEQIFHSHGAQWMKRTPSGVFSAFDGERPLDAALAALVSFQTETWGSLGQASLKIALHAGTAEQWGQDYLGPDILHTRQLLAAAWGGQILLTPAAVKETALPPEGTLRELGPQLLKDLMEPQKVYLFQHPKLSVREFPPLRSLAVYPNNLLYQSTPFFGREEELVQITTMLLNPDVRLVTLMGPGGFGKTRLAFQAAAELADRFPNGAYLVQLAPLSSDQFILEKIAGALHFIFHGAQDPKQQLLQFLRDKNILLVMDNFEHILEGASLVEEILKAAPQVKILVTTRERLKNSRERVFEVRGLRYPDGQQTVGMEGYSAVQLFLKSAKKQDSSFEVKPEDRIAVIRVCQLLEGMPLGIELASTWLKTLTLSQIPEKIETNRDTVAAVMPHLPARHQSLRAVFEYSWILLKEDQKRVLRTASVFRGGFTLDAAKRIAGANASTLKHLEDKFLVRRKPHDRFELHELLKYYAKEKLFDSPLEKEKVQAAHCVYFAQFLRHQEKKLKGSHQRTVLEQVMGEIDNLREGWTWAVDHQRKKEIEDYLDGLYHVYCTKTLLLEGRDVFSRAAQTLKNHKPEREAAAHFILTGKLLARWASFEHQLGQLPKAKELYEESLKFLKRGKARRALGFTLNGMGLEVEGLGNYTKARDYYQKGLRLYRKEKHSAGAAWSLNNLGHLASLWGEHARALKLSAEALVYYESGGDLQGMGWSHNLLGEALHALGRYDEARPHYQKGLAVYLESGDRKGVSWSFTNLGRTLEAMGDFAGAKNMYREGLVLDKEFGNRRGQAWSYLLMGEISWAQGEYAEAKKFYEEGRALYLETGDSRGVAWSWDMEGNLAVAQREYDEAGRCYEKSLAIVTLEGPSLPNRAWYDYHRGALAFFRGQYPPARRWFGKSLKLFEKLNDPRGQVACLTHLGETLLEEGQKEKAAQYFEKALPLALTAKLTPHVVDLVVALAQLLKVRGDERSALVFLVAALNQPTCRRQTKDKIVQFAHRLESKFSTDEVQDAVQQAKLSKIEDLAATWLSHEKKGRPVLKRNGFKTKPSAQARKKTGKRKG